MSRTPSARTLFAAIALLGTAPFAPFAQASPFDVPEKESTPLLGKVDRFLPRDSASKAAPEATLNRTYRLGSEWGKKPVTAASLRDASSAFRRAAQATAKAGGATSFYLGEFDGAHVMATNHHVYPSASRCQSGTVRFPLLDKSFRCNKFVGTWPSIDLSIFVIDVKEGADAASLAQVAANFDWESPVRKGQELITVGFGSADNPLSALMGNQDSDCKVFSGDEEFRLMADPDRLNPGTYKAWSFANACDVSHGDSGSAMVDRESGKPIGIIWTGRIPKSPKVQDSSFLDGLLRDGGGEVWEELSYAVPASKIREQLRSAIKDDGLDARSKAILEALISD